MFVLSLSFACCSIPEYTLTASNGEIYAANFHCRIRCTRSHVCTSLALCCCWLFIHCSWDFVTRELRGVLRCHTDGDFGVRVCVRVVHPFAHTAITCMVLDGNFLITGSDDMSIRVWDSHSAFCVATLRVHTRAFRDVVVLHSAWETSACAASVLFSAFSLLLLSFCLR